EEDLAAARKAISNAEAALKKANEAGENEGKDEIDNEEPKKPAVVLAEARLAVANAELESIQARWAADFAKYAQPREAQVDELAAAAANAERRTAFCKAELAAVQAEQALATAQQAKDPAEAAAKNTAKAALTKAEKDLTTAKE